MARESPSVEPRRPATADEIRDLTALEQRLPSTARWSALLAGGMAGLAAGTAASFSLGSPMAWGIMGGGLGVGGALAAGAIALVVRRMRVHARIEKIRRIADPALAATAPLTDGDRLGDWIVLEASPERLHVARAHSLAAFRLRRAAALAGAMLALAVLIGNAISMFASGRRVGSQLKLGFAVMAALGWLFRYAVSRSPYQWTIEAGEAGPELLLQDAALFGASRLVRIAPAQVRGFEADARQLKVRVDGDVTHPLAGLGGPLAPWRAACIATTASLLLDATLPLTCEDALKRRSVVRTPSELADEPDLSPSTAPP